MLVSQLPYSSQVSYKAIHVSYQAALVAHHCVNIYRNFNESNSVSCISYRLQSYQLPAHIYVVGDEI